MPKRKQHGGKREGAGKPKTLSEPTQPIRLPKSIVQAIKFNGIEWLQNLINREQQGE